MGARGSSRKRKLFHLLLIISVTVSLAASDTIRQNGTVRSENKQDHIGHSVSRSPADKLADPQSRFQLIRATAIFVAKSEFPLSSLLFRLTLQLAVQAVNKRLAPRKVQVKLSIRSASTCQRQYAGALAAEEFHLRRARLFIVSGCDDAIRAVSSLASKWQLPVMTGAGFGPDLDNKSLHKHLIRVAFSLRTAVEFLMKVLKSFQWKRVNLIFDELDPNCLAFKDTIEKHLQGSAKLAGGDQFQVSVNVISLNLQTPDSALMSADQTRLNETDHWRRAGGTTHKFNLPNLSEVNGSSRRAYADSFKQASTVSAPANGADDWPDQSSGEAVREGLKQSALFSRVNILLIRPAYLRRFMLTVHEQGMANGLYSFINLPLLFAPEDAQADEQVASTNLHSSYSVSTGDSAFVWHSAASARNAQARKAYESLMSIYLRSPTSKAYVYFASQLASLANSDYGTTTTTQSSKTNGSSVAQTKLRLDINPYSASFYDCLQIYATILDESLASGVALSELHRNISLLVRDRRFTNTVTGTISINNNGDRETDYTLDDLNQLTGKFNPVIQFRGDTKDIERLARIHWSSDSSVGQTTDDIECQLTGTCAAKPFSKFFVTLLMLAIPSIASAGLIFLFIYKRLSLESQLVDHWWKVGIDEVEIVTTRRKAVGGSSSGHLTGTSSLVSSQAKTITLSEHETKQSRESNTQKRDSLSQSRGPQSELVKSTVTKVTLNSGCTSNTAIDVCYGSIGLGIYRLNKVALKPILKLHQSRKLMIELRTIKSCNHPNLCRFVGIMADEPNLALVSEFCPKGSLREFFSNESLFIDWTFKYSIINDIIAGLSYLHSSEIGYHGRLKSSNCLVSSRFVIKLSDYGLRSLYDQIDEHETEIELQKKQIWLAPEHLKPNSSKMTGSKKGDIYSFGLLLYEIITNNIPFYDLGKDSYIMALGSLLEVLKTSGPCEEIGPDLSIIETTKDNIQDLVALMEQCWQYDLNKRPSCIVVSSALKKITKSITSKKLLENLTGRMEQYTNNLESLVDAKLATLLEEKQKTEELLYQFVPKSVAALLKQGQWIEPEAFDCVTVFYSDIVGFTSLSAVSTPIEVIDFLSDLYLCFDETLENYDIFKVETIGDAYIVASGLPQRNENRHVIEIACAALDLRDKLRTFKIPHIPGKSLEMRVGIHSGPCVAGIVGGVKMPKYCVFGDTLTMGKFMESSGSPMKIHITEKSKSLLEGVSNFSIEAREPKISREGIPIETFWLERLSC